MSRRPRFENLARWSGSRKTAAHRDNLRERSRQFDAEYGRHRTSLEPERRRYFRIAASRRERIELLQPGNGVFWDGHRCYIDALDIGVCDRLAAWL